MLGYFIVMNYGQLRAVRRLLDDDSLTLEDRVHIKAVSDEIGRVEREAKYEVKFFQQQDFPTAAFRERFGVDKDEKL